MSVRLNKLLREANIGLQAFSAILKALDIDEPHLEPSTKISDELFYLITRKDNSQNGSQIFHRRFILKKPGTPKYFLHIQNTLSIVECRVSNDLTDRFRFLLADSQRLNKRINGQKLHIDIHREIQILQYLHLAQSRRIET